MSMSRMQTRPTSEQSPQALNRSRDLLTCLTAPDERRFEIRGGTSGRSRPTAGADVRSRAGLQQVARMSEAKGRGAGVRRRGGVERLVRALAVGQLGNRRDHVVRRGIDHLGGATL